MKKLTPFQKKLARWTGGLGRITVMQISFFLFPLIFMILLVRFHGEKEFSSFEALVLLIGVGIMSYALITLEIIGGNWKQLPEIQAQKAGQFANKYPEYANRINEMIREAYAQDDGGELQFALLTFKILADKEKALADLPKQTEKRAENLKNEIAALEKELELK